MPWTKPYRPANNQRVDPELYESTDTVCFITIRAFAGQSPFVRADLNRLVLTTLNERQEIDNCTVFTYCLMPDHLHFLVSPRKEGVSVLTFGERFKGQATNGSWTTGWHGKLWQPRFYDHIVRQDEDLLAIAQYIVENPVRKELVSEAEEWSWGGEMNPLPLG